jgi:hypothetical protein
MPITFEEIQQSVEFYFLPNANDLKLRHKKISQNECETMVCFLEKNGEKFELSVQLEDEYVNIHLVKILEHKPYEMAFVNYLTTISEMILSLNYLVKLYL